MAVYRLSIDAKLHTAFTGAKATGAARVGSRFTAWDVYISGTHRTLTKGRRIVQDWSTAEWPEGAPPSKLEFTFKTKGNGCKVSMVHSKVPASQAAAYRQGWKDHYWQPLEEYFQRKTRK